MYWRPIRLVEDLPTFQIFLAWLTSYIFSSFFFEKLNHALVCAPENILMFVLFEYQDFQFDFQYKLRPIIGPAFWFVIEVSHTSGVCVSRGCGWLLTLNPLIIVDFRVFNPVGNWNLEFRTWSSVVVPGLLVFTFVGGWGLHLIVVLKCAFSS